MAVQIRLNCILMMRFIIRLSLDDTILFVNPNRLSLVAVLALAQASKEGSKQSNTYAQSDFVCKEQSSKNQLVKAS